MSTRGMSTISACGGRRGQSGVTIKVTRVTATTTMKRARRKKRRGRDTAPGCDIMFTPNETEVGVSEVNAAGYDKLLVSKVDGRVSSHKLEVIMNRLQVCHMILRDDSVDRDVCIPESVLRACERGDISPVFTLLISRAYPCVD